MSVLFSFLHNLDNNLTITNCIYTTFWDQSSSISISGLEFGKSSIKWTPNKDK